MPTMSASSSGLRSRAGRSSALSPASCIRKASTSCCRPPTRSSRPAGRSSSPAAASRQIEQALVDAHRRRPDAIGVAIGFNDGQARRIFAGSDFTLMPSRFEPCGLSQMYAQRFGSLPIGHQTGGLAETIKDGETGFLFDKPRRNPSSAACAGPSRPSAPRTGSTRCAAARWRNPSAGIFPRRVIARCIAR